MLFRLSVATVVIAGLLSASWAQDTPRASLAVMNLAYGGLNTGEELMLAKRLADELAATGMYSLTDKTSRDQMLQARGISQAKPCTETACLTEAGQALGVQKVVGGSVSRYGFTWRVDLRLIDVGTSSEEQFVSRNLEGDLDEFFAAIKLIAEKLSGKSVVFPVPASSASPAGKKNNLTFEQLNRSDKEARLSNVGLAVSAVRATGLKPAMGGKLELGVKLPVDNLLLFPAVEGWVNMHQPKDTSTYNLSIAWEAGLDVALRWTFLGENMVTPYAGIGVNLFYHSYDITRYNASLGDSIRQGKDGRADIGVLGAVGIVVLKDGPISFGTSLEGRAAFNRPCLKWNVEVLVNLGGKKEKDAAAPEPGAAPASDTPPSSPATEPAFPNSN